MAVSYPLINGVRHSWASVEIRILNLVILGITKIDYGSKLEGAVVRGAGPRIIGRTLGISEPSNCSITFLLEEWNTFQNALKSLDPAWKIVNFNPIVQYDQSDSGLSIITDTIQGCRVSEVKVGTTEAGSADPSLREIVCTTQNVLWNGSDGIPAQPVAG